MGGGSFHVLPTQQGSVGTAALCVLLPFVSLGVLCCHLFDRAAQALGTGAFLPRLALLPAVAYSAYRAWAGLLGRERSAWISMVFLYGALMGAGWAASGYFQDQAIAIKQHE